MTTNKEIKLAEIAAQIEGLRTMPEGHKLSRGDNREMIERRRARYIAEGEKALAAVAAMPEGHFNPAFMAADVLFDYAD